MSLEPVAKRVYVTLPDTVTEDLQRWAEKRDQALATVAAIAIELYLGQLKQTGELPAADQITPAESGKSSEKEAS